MNKIIIKLIKYYQATTKDKKKWCKYYPTCSNYALGCFQKFNFFKALFLTIYRILRCNPFSKGGYDTIPLTRKEKRELKNSLKETSNTIKNTDEEI